MGNFLRSNWFGILAALLLIPSVAASTWKYWPPRHESYTNPTTLSYFIQKRLPWLYRPPADIFAGRYGQGAMTAILGPDCRRFVFGDTGLFSQMSPPTFRVHSCSKPIDLQKFMAFLKSGHFVSTAAWTYAELKPEELSAMLVEPKQTVDEKSAR